MDAREFEKCLTLIKQKKLIKITNFSIMENPTTNDILFRYSDLRSKEATELDKYIDEINTASYNKEILPL